MNSGKLAGYILLSLAFCSTSFATMTAGPYQGIIDRNVFGLKTPPPPAAPGSDTPKTPLPPITLNGITTLLGNKRAFLTMQAPAKPPAAAKPQTFMLSEGQRDGDLEMIEIDEKEGSVKVNAFGTITNIHFAKLTASTAPPTAGGHTGATGIPAPPPNPFAPGFNRSIPSRQLRMPSMTPQGQPNGTGQGQATGAGAPVSSAGALDNGGGLTSINGSPIGKERTAEEAVALYEANRMKNQQLIDQGATLPRMPQHLLLGRPGQNTVGGGNLSPQ